MSTSPRALDTRPRPAPRPAGEAANRNPTRQENLPESIRFGRAPSYGEIEKHYVILHDGAVTYYYFFVMGMKGESVNHALHAAFQTSGWLHLEAFASPTVFAAWTSAAGSASAIVAAQNIPWLPKFHPNSAAVSVPCRLIIIPQGGLDKIRSDCWVSHATRLAR